MYPHVRRLASLSRAALVGSIVGLSLLSACSPSTKGIMEASEERLGVGDNFAGADGRQFHRIIHYPNAVGPRFPGYIVGLEKASSSKIKGPSVDRDLVEFGFDSNLAHLAMLYAPKTHFVSHIMSYWADAGGTAVYRNRMQVCGIYGALPDAADDASSEFEWCAPGNPYVRSEAVGGAFEQSWRGLARFKRDLAADIAARRAEGTPYSHIFVVVMGWNTPQEEAVQNYNSMIGNLLDEADALRRKKTEQWFAERCGGSSEEECKADRAAVFAEGCKREHLPECNFRPLLIGVTWASDWEISPWLALPPALVRAVSFPDKANDAEEIGITWLRALLQYVVLPARNEADGGVAPRVIMMGHSFGARATMAALSQDTGLRKPRSSVLAAMDAEDKVDQLAPVSEYRRGDRFISLEGAYKIARLFQDDAPTKLQPNFTRDGLHANLIASEFDAAVNTAFWGDYAGAVNGYDALCGPSASQDVVNAVDCRAIAVDKKGLFGRAECATPTRAANNRGSGAAPVLYVDASSVVNCNAAFTGGGSHSDIYRREMSRLLWDLIVNDAREVERSAYNSTERTGG